MGMYTASKRASRSAELGTGATSITRPASSSRIWRSWFIGTSASSTRYSGLIFDSASFSNWVA